MLCCNKALFLDVPIHVTTINQSWHIFSAEQSFAEINFVMTSAPSWENIFWFLRQNVVGRSVESHSLVNSKEENNWEGIIRKKSLMAFFHVVTRTVKLL